MFISAQATEHHAVFSTNKMSIQEKEVTALSIVLKILICHQLCMTNAGKEQSPQEEKHVRALERQKGPSPQCLSPAPNFLSVTVFLDGSLGSVSIAVKEGRTRGGSLFCFLKQHLRLTLRHLTSKDKQHHSATMLKLD